MIYKICLLDVYQCFKYSYACRNVVKLVNSFHLLWTGYVRKKTQHNMRQHQFFTFFFPFFPAVSCGIPESPGNGSVIGNEFTLGSRLIYECNEGFKLESSQQATAVCQEDGLWSNKGRPPVCKCK